MLQYPSSIALLFRIELYSSVIYDLRIGGSCLCGRFQIHPPSDEERLIQIYAVATHIIGKLITVRISIAIPGNLVDVEVFRVWIIWKVLLSGYTPLYAYELGALDTRMSFSDLRKVSYINPKAHVIGNDSEFSKKIRESIPRMNQ